VTGSLAAGSASDIRTEKLPSGRSGTGSPCSVTWAFGSVTPNTNIRHPQRTAFATNLPSRVRLRCRTEFPSASPAAAKAFFQKLLQFQASARAAGIRRSSQKCGRRAARRRTSFRRPSRSCWRRCGNGVATRQTIELTVVVMVADFQPELARRLVNVDVPMAYAPHAPESAAPAPRCRRPYLNSRNIG